jgi:molybdopterin converting factor small subunit
VIFAGLVRRVVGTSEIRLALPSGSTLGDLLRELSARLGPEFEDYVLADGDVAPHALIMIDGRYARELGGIHAPLGDREDSEVEIVLLGPPLMGG